MDAWTWVARYDDGSSISELDPHGDHGFADVELDRVCAFELHPVDPSNVQASFCVVVNPQKGEVPFFVRTRASSWLLAGGDDELLHTVLGLRQSDGQTLYVTFDDERRVVISSERLL